VNGKQIKAIRVKMGLTQQDFGTLLGFSFVSINKWENDRMTPSGISEALLVMLNNALQLHAPAEVISELRKTTGLATDVIRTLARLERPT
jgi:transcriptional regulator with XRE-family HTH domain